jgi:hypothetical protein
MHARPYLEIEVQVGGQALGRRDVDVEVEEGQVAEEVLDARRPLHLGLGENGKHLHITWYGHKNEDKNTRDHLRAAPTSTASTRNPRKHSTWK